MVHRIKGFLEIYKTCIQGTFIVSNIIFNYRSQSENVIRCLISFSKAYLILFKDFKIRNDIIDCNTLLNSLVKTIMKFSFACFRSSADSISSPEAAPLFSLLAISLTSSKDISRFKLSSIRFCVMMSIEGATISDSLLSLVSVEFKRVLKYFATSILEKFRLCLSFPFFNFFQNSFGASPFRFQSSVFLS